MLYFTGSRTPHHSERLSVTARTACAASIWSMLHAHFMQPDTESFNQNTAPYNYISTRQLSADSHSFITEPIVPVLMCAALSFFMGFKKQIFS